MKALDFRVRFGVIGLIAMSYFASAPAVCLEGSLTTLMWWNTTGPVENLRYNLHGDHTTIITQFDTEESPWPVAQVGSHVQDYSPPGYGACYDFGIVNQALFNCPSFFMAPCPYAQGIWVGQTRTSIGTPPLGQVVVGISANTLHANCPDDPGCLQEFRRTRLVVVDLESGRVMRPDWPFRSPAGLTRRETVDGQVYVQEEWILAELQNSESGLGAITLDASSSSAIAQESIYATALETTTSARSGARYLVIEVARHVTDHFKPLVRRASLSTGAPLSGLGQDGRVTFRVSFSALGELEDVQTIEGDEYTARRLAEDLRLEFPLAHEDPAAVGHAGHRTVVFASFVVRDGQARASAVIPEPQQCCCELGPGGETDPICIASEGRFDG